MISPEIIISISSGVQAITTIILVVITYKQIQQARRSVESMERSIKADFLPVLMLGHARYSSTDKTLNIQLTNCGKGLARKPKIIFPGQPDITLNSINIGEDDNATINYSLEYILTKITERDRKIIIEYHDVFGRKIITEANLLEINDLGTSGNQRGIGWESWTPIIP